MNSIIEEIDLVNKVIKILRLFYMSLIEELKRRKVFRVAASYAVVAFIIFQLVEILFPIFNFPQWTQQFVVIIFRKSH